MCIMKWWLCSFIFSWHRRAAFTYICRAIACLSARNHDDYNDSTYKRLIHILCVYFTFAHQTCNFRERSMQKVNIIRQSNLFSGLMALGIQHLPRSYMKHKRGLILTARWSWWWRRFWWRRKWGAKTFPFW